MEQVQTRDRLDLAAVSLLFVALVYAAVDHGGFFRTGFRVAVLLILAAAVLSLLRLPASARDLNAPLLAVSALALWYVVAAVVAGDVAGAAPALELLAALAAVLVIVRRATKRDRERLLYGVLFVGMVVAITGWVGLVWRRTPLAIQDTCCGGIWRAASTITYANAAAALLTMCLLVAVSLLARARRTRPLLLIVFVLLVGLLATLSRGGWLGFLIGLVVLAVIDGIGAFVRSWPAFLGAAVAAAALVPAMPLTHHPHIVLACAGLLAGALITLLPAVWVVTAMGALALVVVIVPGPRHSVRDNWETIGRGRFNTSSPDRTRALDAAFRLAGEHRVTGVGPGHVDLVWRSTDPNLPGLMHGRYAHNEYVQVLAETGDVGFAVLVCGLAATSVAVYRRRRSSESVAAAGCIAALVALGVHSATDYLWHIPVVPLTAAVLVAVLLPSDGTEPLHEG
jgi:O-antigen ligase